MAKAKRAITTGRRATNIVNAAPQAVASQRRRQNSDRAPDNIQASPPTIAAHLGAATTVPNPDLQPVPVAPAAASTDGLRLYDVVQLSDPTSLPCFHPTEPNLVLLPLGADQGSIPRTEITQKLHVFCIAVPEGHSLHSVFVGTPTTRFLTTDAVRRELNITPGQPVTLETYMRFNTLVCRKFVNRTGNKFKCLLGCEGLQDRIERINNSKVHRNGVAKILGLEDLKLLPSLNTLCPHCPESKGFRGLDELSIHLISQHSGKSVDARRLSGSKQYTEVEFDPRGDECPLHPPTLSREAIVANRAGSNNTPQVGSAMDDQSQYSDSSFDDDPEVFSPPTASNMTDGDTADENMTYGGTTEEEYSTDNEESTNNENSMYEESINHDNSRDEDSSEDESSTDEDVVDQNGHSFFREPLYSPPQVATAFADGQGYPASPQMDLSAPSDSSNADSEDLEHQRGLLKYSSLTSGIAGRESDFFAGGSNLDHEVEDQGPFLSSSSSNDSIPSEDELVPFAEPSSSSDLFAPETPVLSIFGSPIRSPQRATFTDLENEPVAFASLSPTRRRHVAPWRVPNFSQPDPDSTIDLDDFRIFDKPAPASPFRQFPTSSMRQQGPQN